VTGGKARPNNLETGLNRAETASYIREIAADIGGIAIYIKEIAIDWSEIATYVAEIAVDIEEIGIYIKEIDADTPEIDADGLEIAIDRSEIATDVAEMGANHAGSPKFIKLIERLFLLPPVFQPDPRFSCSARTGSWTARLANAKSAPPSLSLP